MRRQWLAVLSLLGLTAAPVPAQTPTTSGTQTAPSTSSNQAADKQQKNRQERAAAPQQAMSKFEKSASAGGNDRAVKMNKTAAERKAAHDQLLGKFKKAQTTAPGTTPAQALPKK
jgi:hypothetical protein